MKKSFCLLTLFTVPLGTFGFDWQDRLQTVKTAWDEIPLSTKVLSGVVLVGASGFYYLNRKLNWLEAELNSACRIQRQMNDNLWGRISDLKHRREAKNDQESN